MGRRALTSRAEIVWGTISEKTEASRIRLAITCVYWDPKSRIRTRSTRLSGEMEFVAFKKTTSPIWQKSSSVTAQSVRNSTPGPIVLRLWRVGFSRLLRCVYPALLSGPVPTLVGAREVVALPHNLALKYFERICAPADLPPRQSYFASGGWNSLACFAALERI